MGFPKKFKSRPPYCEIMDDFPKSYFIFLS